MTAAVHAGPDRNHPDKAYEAADAIEDGAQQLRCLSGRGCAWMISRSPSPQEEIAFRKCSSGTSSTVTLSGVRIQIVPDIGAGDPGANTSSRPTASSSITSASHWPPPSLARFSF